MAQETPIIILGNQKSGTTAIASLLADYGGLTKTLDIPEIWSNEQALHDGTLSFQTFVESHQHRFSTQVVKEPCLTFLYEQCLASFPSSPYIFIIRHPADNIRSILDRLKIPGNKDYIDFNDYAMNETWSYVMNGQLLAINHDHYIARLAMRWVIAAEVYLQNKENMKLVRYEDFMGNKYETIQRLAEGLGVKERTDIESLLNVQYQPLGENRENSMFDFFDEENLSVIFDVCRSYMKYFDYHWMSNTR